MTMSWWVLCCDSPDMFCVCVVVKTEFALPLGQINSKL